MEFLCPTGGFYELWTGIWILPPPPRASEDAVASRLINKASRSLCSFWQIIIVLTAQRFTTDGFFLCQIGLAPTKFFPMLWRSNWLLATIWARFNKPALYYRKYSRTKEDSCYPSFAFLHCIARLCSSITAAFSFCKADKGSRLCHESRDITCKHRSFRDCVSCKFDKWMISGDTAVKTSHNFQSASCISGT